MAYKITDACIGCGVCATNCPIDAISLNEVATIDEKACILCGMCAAICPVSAIENNNFQ